MSWPRIHRLTSGAQLHAHHSWHMCTLVLHTLHTSTQGKGALVDRAGRTGGRLQHQLAEAKVGQLEQRPAEPVGPVGGVPVQQQVLQLQIAAGHALHVHC